MNPSDLGGTPTAVTETTRRYAEIFGSTVNIGTVTNFDRSASTVPTRTSDRRTVALAARGPVGVNVANRVTPLSDTLPSSRTMAVTASVLVGMKSATAPGGTI